MTGPVAALLPDGARLHLQHGPIDLIIGADGDRAGAFDAAAARFRTLLDELVAELPLLRSQAGGQLRGEVALRMERAVRPHRRFGFITPMAAVAGAVADRILAAMQARAEITRAYVNNGGDIALHLSGAARFRMAIADPRNGDLGRIDLAATDPVRGIATSGQGGRSLSRGIADAVTVLARDSAAADAAATLIANAVDLPGHAHIRRIPARDADPDSDLGARPVVCHVGALSDGEIVRALARGADLAVRMQRSGLIHGAALFLRGHARLAGLQRFQLERMAEHA